MQPQLVRGEAVSNEHTSVVASGHKSELGSDHLLENGTYSMVVSRSDDSLFRWDNVEIQRGVSRWDVNRPALGFQVTLSGYSGATLSA